MSTLHIKLFGEFSLNDGNTAVQTVGAPRLQSLLAHLVLQRGISLSRRHLAFNLWPDSSEAQARTNLRREVHSLRQALPALDVFLSVDTQTLRWSVDAPFTLDVADFEQAVAEAKQAGNAVPGSALRAMLERAISLYKGDLLPGCYDDFILNERERLHQMYLTVLAQAIDLLQQQRDYPSAIECAQRLLRADPLAEEAYLHLIRLYALNGERARSLRAYHKCVTVLQQELGVEPGSATRHAYEQVLNTTGLHKTQPVHQPASFGAYPMVGRQAQWQQVQTIWQEAAGGQPRILVVSGEAGIGKTRLLEELAAWVNQQGTVTAVTRCYAAEGGLAYAPVTNWLRSAQLHEQLLHLEDAWLLQLVRLLPELQMERSDLPPPAPITESWQQQHFLEALARSLLIRDRPILLVIDDLQWVDQETLILLHFLLRHEFQSPFLIAGSLRSTELLPEHPLASWMRELRQTGLLVEVALDRLNEHDTTQLTAHLIGTTPDMRSASRLYAETEGNPLFVIETVRAGNLGDPDERITALPPKIQMVILSRLAQLSPLARRIANIAAVIGRSFAYDVLAEASLQDEISLVQGLDELWQRQIIREQSENEYDFSHDRIREVTYNSLSLVNRRLLHRRTAQAMKLLYADDLNGVSKQLAYHYEMAGAKELAIDFYQRAGQVAQHLYANSDAIQLYSKALALLEQLPASRERAERELALQQLLSVVYKSTKGFAAAEIGQSLHRAHALCYELTLTDALCPILWGLFTYHYVRADVQQACDYSEELFGLAQKQSDPAIHQLAHHAMGATRTTVGKLVEARQHFDQVLSLYEPSQHQSQVAMCGIDLGVFCQAWSAHPLWLLGDWDYSLQRSRSAIARAEQLAHPFTQALAMAYATMLFQFMRDGDLVKQWAEATLRFCADSAIVYYDDWASILRGWALTEQGYAHDGLKQMQQGLEGLKNSDSRARLPYYLTIMAEAYERTGALDTALELTSEALKIATMSRDYWYSAEIHRLMGHLLLHSGDVERATTWLLRALDISRQQGSQSFVLRTTVSLAQLWQQQQQPEKAVTELERVLSHFNFQPETADLRDARNLLQELSHHHRLD